MLRFNLAVLVLLQLLCLRLEFAAQPQVKEARRGTATVSGKVLLNGAPLGDVRVVLRPERPTSREELKGFEAKSDNGGNYRITGLAAGHYYLNALAPGFVLTGRMGSGFQSKILIIAAGEKLENINLELRRAGAITGRVIDSNGNPVAEESIDLIKLGDDGTPPPPSVNTWRKATDDHGVYRFTGLPEGRYLVSVGVSPDENANRTSSYPRIFYPGVTDQSQAMPVQVAEGEEVTDVNISGIVAKKAYEISGRVVYAETEAPAEGVMVSYGAMSRDGGVISRLRSSKERSNAKGEFQIQGVPPGKYAVYAHTIPKQELFSDPVVCEITDGGRQGIELRIHGGGSISGAVVIESSNDKAAPANLSQLRITGNLMGKPYIQHQLRRSTGINADGSFHIKGLPRGKVKLSLDQDPKLGLFLVKRVERDGVQQPDGIEISPGENVSDVRVVVEYGNLTLRGEVKIIGGNLPPTRWIYAKADRLNESPLRRYGASIDERGQFVFENLPPGEYEVSLLNVYYQVGKPHDKSVSNLISSATQKVSLDGANHAPITLVLDLSRKEGDH
jgi:Carboxypeptidase regulatory-like domain